MIAQVVLTGFQPGISGSTSAANCSSDSCQPPLVELLGLGRHALQQRVQLAQVRLAGGGRGGDVGVDGGGAGRGHAVLQSPVEYDFHSGLR